MAKHNFRAGEVLPWFRMAFLEDARKVCQFSSIGEYGDSTAFEEQKPDRFGLGRRLFGQIGTKHRKSERWKVSLENAQCSKRRFAVSGVPFE